MKKKTKIIVFSSVLAVVFIAIVAVVAVYKTTAASDDSTAEVWKEKPFIYETSQTDKAYETYQEPFANAFIALKTELEVKSADGAEYGIISAYVSAEQTPTMIIAYDNTYGSVNLLVCKFYDGSFYKTYIETGVTELSDKNDIAIVSGSDIIALRTGISEECGRQVIYDFSGGSYCAVKDAGFEYGSIEDMYEALELYNADATVISSYNELAVKQDVVSTLCKFTGYESQDGQ